MKTVLSHTVVCILAFILGFLISQSKIWEYKEINIAGTPIKIEKPLERYSIPNLTTTQVPKGEIKIDKQLTDDDDFTSHLFFHEFSPTLDNKMSKVSGQINIPKSEGKFPIILMFRGYVDQSIYQTGVGTRRAAEECAKNGFITVAPDFLGYGESSTQAGNVLEARFQSYTTALSVFNSLSSIEKWDGENIFIWGHSNGGLVALTLLEITQREIPTVLWAPVSKPFPYSVLYYTDESEDKGKFLRAEIAKFEALYDAYQYSFDNYLNQIKAPVEIYQGTADDAVPLVWSLGLKANLEKNEIETNIYTYRNADHNLQPGWDDVVSKNISFFKGLTKEVQF